VEKWREDQGQSSLSRLVAFVLSMCLSTLLQH